ncbi:MAG: hypothetical protein K2Q19_05670 [Rhodocyclaceae bacterium]|nr:hypothetical protein [Rhodocyclaceae bacterium]
MRGHRYTKRLGYAMLDKLWVILLIGVSVMLLVACDANVPGPAERAGKEVDKAAASLGDKVEKAGERIKDGSGADKP